MIVRAIFVAIAGLSLAACTKKSPPPPIDENAIAVTPEAGAPLPSSSAAPPMIADAAAPAVAADVDAGANDFEDQFEYGEYDAGPGDPSALTKKPGYDSYANPRFGFSLDVPRALTAMPGPDNGDGMQWRLGTLVSMTASGMNNMPELGSMPLCASSKNVVAHSESKSGCFSTGKRNGTIFWERYAVTKDTVYSLRFQYSESLKSAMDAIVTHVNASWLHGS